MLIRVTLWTITDRPTPPAQATTALAADWYYIPAIPSGAPPPPERPRPHGPPRLPGGLPRAEWADLGTLARRVAWCVDDSVATRTARLHSVGQSSPPPDVRPRPPQSVSV